MIITFIIALTTTIFIGRRVSLWFDVQCFYFQKLFQSLFMYSVTQVIQRVVGNRFSPFSFPDINNGHSSKEWLRSVIQHKMSEKNVTVPKIEKVEFSSESIHGGLTGDLKKLIITWSDNSDERLPKSLIVKSTYPTLVSFIGCAFTESSREVWFSKQFAQDEIFGTPIVYYAETSEFTRQYLIVMEDLSDRAVLVGHLLGNQCWGKKKIPSNVEQDPVRIIEVLYKQAAKMHAKFWRDESLLRNSWMKSAEYLKGQNRVKWEFSMESIRHKWNRVKSRINKNQTGVKWSDKLIKEADATLRNTSWENFQRAFDVKDKNTAFTLCHGDYHGGNVLWSQDQKNSRIPAYNVDWSEAGVFCPFTDLAQFVISHLPIETRRKHEYNLFKTYYVHLIKNGVSAETFPLDACWERYKSGGIERWIQMLILLDTLDLPEFSIQWFHDQVAAFIEDHGSHRAMLCTAYCFP